MAMFGSSMPLPVSDPETQEFWAACAEHRLVVQQCTQCEAYRFAPAPICYHCQSFDVRSVESAGIGELYTWTVVYRALHPATESAVPYNTAVVRLLDCGGAMITTNIVEVDNDELVAGMRVHVKWDDVADGVALPRFAPVVET
jgi:uncharacterized protein